MAGRGFFHDYPASTRLDDRRTAIQLGCDLALDFCVRGDRAVPIIGPVLYPGFEERRGLTF